MRDPSGEIVTSPIECTEPSFSMIPETSPERASRLPDRIERPSAISERCMRRMRFPGNEVPLQLIRQYYPASCGRRIWPSTGSFRQTTLRGSGTTLLTEAQDD